MIPILLPALAAVSAFGLYMSVQSIRNVREYEEKTKKAAKVSNTAEEQLNSTRTTEAAGALSLTVSLAVALAFTLYPSQSVGLKLGLAGFNISALAFAADHISRFWHGKAKVPLPGLGSYNESITQMDTLTKILWLLAIGWVGEMGMSGWQLMSR